MEDLHGIYWAIVIIMIYFLPAINAKLKKHGSTMAIFIINLFLGWTLLAWVICLAWSFPKKEH